MKLLSRLSIRYLVFSMVVMIVSGIAIYLIFSVIIRQQIDEQLSGNLTKVETHLAETHTPFLIEPFGTIQVVGQSTESVVFSDTLIYNPTDEESEEFRQVRATKRIDDTFYRITLLKSKIESGDLQETLAVVLILALLIMTIALTLLNRKVARWVWQPFFSNLGTISRFSVTDQKPLELGNTGISEFDQLNRVLEKLTGKIISDFRNQRQFSEDVSHELQTPLAIIMSRIESLLNDPELDRRHSVILSGIYTTTQRLSKLNKELILLSKIENNQFASDEKIIFRNLISEKLEEFGELIRLKNLITRTEIYEDSAVTIDPTLAGILIDNLLSNCIRHTPEGGTILIKAGGGKLVFSNSGTSPIPDTERLFSRFYKADPTSGSPGLGLAIVKKICDLHHINIWYSFTDSLHCFTVEYNL